MVKQRVEDLKITEESSSVAAHSVREGAVSGESMKLVKHTIAIAALMFVASPLSWGLGLGEVVMQSYLNEPLRAEVVLLDVKKLAVEDIKIRIATQDDFDRLGVERAYFLTNIKFDIVLSGEQSKIILTTSQPLLEPYLDFLLETRWPAGRLLRSYTVLVDLPRRVGSVSSAASMQRDMSSPSNASVSAERQGAPEVSLDGGANKDIAAPSRVSQRRYDQEAEAQPRAGGQYLVQKNDTLWDIAVAARPANATLEQTMIATAAMNSDAFTGGNINGLKAGYVLELPGEDDIFSSDQEARDGVARQHSDWAAGVRRRPALRVVADNEFKEPTADVSEAPESAFTATATAPSSDARDSSEDVDSASVQTDLLAGRVDEQREGTSQSNQGAARESPELAAIAARLSRLSDQVGDLRQLVTVKDQQIAALQAQLAERDAMGSIDSREVGEAGSRAPPASTTESPGLPWWVFALGGVVLVSLGSVVYARRGPSRPMATSFNSAGLTATQRSPVMPGAKLPAQPRPGSTSRITSGAGRAVEDDQADGLSNLLAEADIYLSYGRYQQALDLLVGGAKTAPNNPQLLLKMLEVYLTSDRREEGEALAASIEATGDSHAIEQAKTLLASSASRASSVDLGELVDPFVFDNEPSVNPEQADQGHHDSLAPSDDLNIGDDELELELSMPTADSESLEPLDFAPDGEGLTDLMASENVLPPELAEVLGSEVPPPFEEAEQAQESGLIYSVETDPMDTKLDLARAYIDMADEDGARPVLDEVISKGNLQQQAEARELMLRIE